LGGIKERGRYYALSTRKKKPRRSLSFLLDRNQRAVEEGWKRGKLKRARKRFKRVTFGKA